MRNQNEKIADFMEKFGGITAREAYEYFGCMRLSARIYDLKKQGYLIKGETECGCNRFGEPTTYTHYYIVKNAQKQLEK